MFFKNTLTNTNIHIGFGGTNAHAILEAYEHDSASSSQGVLFSPLTFSAATEKSLRALISAYLEYLQANPDVSLRDLAYTLQERRSTLAFRAAFNATSASDVAQKISALLESKDAAELSNKHFSIPKPRVLGVFTGQGAQWPRMAANLLESSPFVSKRLKELDSYLAGLPQDIRPSWTLEDQIMAEGDNSRVTEAAISQPLCTAIQILLVDLLNAAGVKLMAVVGHSSGMSNSLQGLYAIQSANMYCLIR